MEKEISSGAMLGIVLIALAAIIGIGFGIFAIAKGTANSGTTDVQDQLEGVSQSTYTDFDQTVVTGQKVLNALDTFSGKSCAVLISTQSTKDLLDGVAMSETVNGSGVFKDTSSGITAKYGATKSVPVVYVCKSADDKTKADGASLSWTTSKDKATTSCAYVNYNSLLASEADTSTYSSKGKTPRIYFDKNCFKTVEGYYVTDANKIGTNQIVGNLTKSGTVEYIPTSARFSAYLVKDTTGSIVGVAFDQVSGK